MYKHLSALPTELSPEARVSNEYRVLAIKLREVASQTRLPVARRELLRIATNYDRRADHIDRRT